MTDRHKGHLTQVQIPDERWDQLVEAARDHDVSANWLINKALMEFLDRLLPAKEVKWTR